MPTKRNVLLAPTVACGTLLADRNITVEGGTWDGNNVQQTVGELVVR